MVRALSDCESDRRCEGREVNKKTCKDLAVEIAKLRPNEGTPEDKLWRDMVHVVSEAVPWRWANAFGSACTNRGIWIRDYEDNSK